MPDSWNLRGAASIRSTRKQETMVGVYLKSAVAGAFLLGMATAAMAVTGGKGVGESWCSKWAGGYATIDRSVS